MQNEIKVPVRLEVLKDSISQIQGVLSHLQPDSSGYKRLSKYLKEITSEMTRFEAQTSNAFSNEANFNKAGKSIDKMEESLSKARIAINDLKFSDIKLDANQLDAFKKLDQELDSISNKLKEVKEKTKQDILSDDVTKNLISSIDPQYIKHSFDELSKIIDTEVDRLSAKTLQATNKLNDFLRKRDAKSSEITALTTHGISKEGLGEDVFNRFFKELRTGVIGFNSRDMAAGEAKKQFLDYLAKEFTLTKADIAEIESRVGKGSANDFSELFKRMGKYSATNIFSNRLEANTFTDINNLKKAVEEAMQAQKAYEEVQDKFRNAQSDEGAVGQAAEVFAGALERVHQASEKLKSDDLQHVQNLAKVGQGFGQATQEIEQFRNTLEKTKVAFLQQERAIQTFNRMKFAIINFMGFNQVLRITQQAVRNAINHIKELDSVMNKISIVTDMSTGDLWNQVEAYSKMAQMYGVSIKGAYEVSQIYYQQGLETKDVMTLTNETLKLAKISGLDYATTTDYMTTALRGFKMEMSEASTVVDVYSNLAAHTAVSQEELAVAMSKTASSMQSVGATFEEASAMIGTMVAVTRESATNIGSAMKSIASRYGELTKDPTKLVDEEGEAMAFNKVDAALQSVGISMKTVDGQFRNFTEVIIELGEKWNELNSTQQRYIATQFAGNRQQSRFLALVSNIDLLKSNLDYAENSEDTGTLQALKALDSIESKIEQVRVAYQQFYTTIGAEDAWKGFLDGTKVVINTLNRMPKLFGKIPVAALNSIGLMIGMIKNLGLRLLSGFAQTFGSSIVKGMVAANPEIKAATETLINTVTQTVQNKTGEVTSAGQQLGRALNEGLDSTVFTRSAMHFQDKNKISDWSARAATANGLTGDKAKEAWGGIASEMQAANLVNTNGFNIISAGGENAYNVIMRLVTAFQQYGGAAAEANGRFQQFVANHQKGLETTVSFGQALTVVAGAIDTTSQGGKQLSSVLMALGGTITTVATLIKAGGDLAKVSWLTVASGVIAAVSGIVSFINSFSIEAKLEELTAKAEELTNKAKEAKASFNTLNKGIKKYEELKEKRYESAEAAEDYQSAVDDLTEKFPQLISQFDEAGNVILDTVSIEQVLTQAREEAAEATYNAAKAEAERAKVELEAENKTLKDKKSKVASLYNTDDVFSEEAGDRVLARNGQRTISYNDLAYNSSFFNTFKELAEANKLNKTQKELYDRMLTPEINGSSYNLIRSLFKQINSEDNNESIKATVLIETLFDTMGYKMDKAIQDQFNSLRQEASKIAPLNHTIETANKASVNAWLRKSDAYNETPIIRNNTGVFQALQEELYKQAEGNFEEGHLTNIGERLITEASDLWKKLDEATQEEVNKVFENSEKYTTSDLQNIFDEAKVNAPNWIYSIFKTQNENIKTNIKSHLNSIYDESNRDNDVYTKVLGLVEDDAREFTVAEEKALIASLSSITSLQNKGFDTTVITDSIISLFNSFDELSADARNALVSQIVSNGQTIDGWKKTLNYVKEADTFDFSAVSTNDIDNIINETIPNYELITSSLMSSLEEQWTDIDKFFQSLTKGVSTVEKGELIRQAEGFGLNIEDKFSLGEKGWVVTAENLNEIISTYRSNLRSQFESLQSDLSLAYVTLQSNDVFANGGVSKNELKSISVVLQERFNEFFKFNDQTKKWTFQWLNEEETPQEASERLQQALEEKYHEDSEKIQQILDWYDSISADLAQDTQWALGDYSSLANTTKGKFMFNSTTSYKDKMEAIYDRLLVLAAGLDELDDDELLDKQWKVARDSLREGFSTLISDVVSKGVSEINLDDYNGFYDKETILADLHSLTNEQFVSKYIEYTHKTIEEQNNLLFEAYEKDNKAKNSDLIKDLQFTENGAVEVNRSQLKELANAFGKKYKKILDNLNISFDEVTGKAIVSIEALASEGIDLESIDGSSQIITESIRSLFSNIASAIENAFDGKASSEDKTTLQNFAKRAGVGELHFTETVDGAKVATAEILKLYNALQLLDSLNGNRVFDSLMERLIKSTHEFETVGSNLAYIKELITKRDGEADPARRDMYQQELELAERILAVRSTQEDSSFNFMSNKIPAAQNNPLNYFSNWQKGWQALQEGLKSGYMDYTDFYNLFTEMGNLAEKSGKITLGANTVLRNSEDAAKLITQAAGTLTVDEATGKLQISFDSLAQLGIDFGAAGAEMDENVTKGIQDYAKAQVEMLDGMIQMLETIVEMEKLGDVAGEDHQIDLGEILVGGITGTDAQYESKYDDARNSIIEAANNNKQLKENLESILIGNKSLWEILNQDASQFQAEEAKAINALYQVFQSDSYDKDSILKSIQDLYGSEGLDITIEDGKWTITFKEPDVEVGTPGTTTESVASEVKNGVEELLNIDSKENPTEIETTASIKVNAEKSSVELVGKLPQLVIDSLDASVLALKLLQGWTEPDESNIIPPAKLSKDIESLKAYVNQLELLENSEGFINEDNIELPEQLSKTIPAIKAFIDKLELLQNDSTAITDDGIKLPEDYKTDIEQIQALIQTVKFSLTEEAEIVAKTGPTSDELGIPKDFYGTEARTFHQEVETEYEVKDTKYNDIRKALYGFNYSPSAGVYTRKEQIAEIDKLGADLHNNKINLNGVNELVEGAPNLKQYVNYLQSLVQQGQALGSLDLSNLNKLKKLPLVDEDAAQIDNLLKDYALLTQNTPEEIKVGLTVTEETKTTLQEQIESIKPQVTVTIPQPDTSPIKRAVENMGPLSKTVKLVASDETGDGGGVASGTIGLANAKGTLMGELGPELVVSKGRYFVVGQSGPEMVDLADDAIVFNHLQTKSLLNKGTSSGRGKAITNERKAVSYATGNINGGPAKASASDALAALRQLRAEWQAIANMSVKDLAGKGGGGGGGGGDPKAFIKELERWYDWLQQIAQLEKEITLEEAKRTKYQNDMVARGKEYFTSQMASLEKLQEQAITQQSLNDAQEEYFEKRRKELNEQSAFSSLYGFSETGQIYYKNVGGDKDAFEWFANLVGSDNKTNRANYTAEEQYNQLVKAGFEFAMQYDSSGNEIKKEGTDWYSTAVQAFWDKIDSDQQEMQSLHDSIEDGKKKYIDLLNSQNEILHEIEDNQIAVEQKVLKAVEEMRQRAIDQMKDNKDALEEGAKALTDGLSKQLDNERKMLDNQKNADELASLQRRLGILQRSGGSASQIADLQQQITDKQQDKYFDMQEQQIQAIQDASDAEIERLDRQIALEEEQLEYEKEHGMLWMDVDDVLSKSSEDIVNFIQGNTSEYWSKSTTELQKVLREDLFEVDRFKQFQATVEEGMDALIEKYGTEEQKKALADKKRAEAAAKDAQAEATVPANNEQASTPKNEPTRITGTGEFRYKSIDDTYHMKSEKLTNGTFKDRGKEKHNFVNGKCNRCGYSALNLSKGPINDDFANKIVSDKDELSKLQDSLEKTRTLTETKQALLQHKTIDISQSALASFQTAYKGLSSNVYDSIQNNSNNTTIQHAEVNLNVDKIANDYDAKRAADTVIDAILHLRSKSSANNSVRG